MNNFNKKAFSEILQKVYDLYPNQRAFAERADINRTYISKYINQRMNVPPSAKILRRLAKASKGLIAYQELMKICGYLNDDESIITFSQITMKSNQRENKLEQIINLIDGLTIDEFNLLKAKIKDARIKISKEENK